MMISVLEVVHEAGYVSPRLWLAGKCLGKQNKIKYVFWRSLLGATHVSGNQVSGDNVLSC